MNKNATELTKKWTELIDLRYDPENDTIPNAPRVTHTDKLLCDMISDLAEKIDSLEEKVAAAASKIEDCGKQAASYHDEVIPEMNAVRKAADALEMIVDADLWPLPSYAEMLFMR